MAASYTKKPVISELRNFQSTYFEEHLQTAASENVFLRRIFIKRINFTLKTGAKPGIFQDSGGF